jgi:hypothetical protein
VVKEIANHYYTSLSIDSSELEPTILDVSTIAPTPGAPATAGVGACFMVHVAGSAQADRRAQLCEGASLGP